MSQSRDLPGASQDALPHPPSTGSVPIEPTAQSTTGAPPVACRVDDACLEAPPRTSANLPPAFPSVRTEPGSAIPTPDDEAHLLVRLRARDEAAFEELVRTHGHRMLSVARRFFADESDAQDALQDAFLNVHRSVSGFSGDSRLGTWLHRIVVNASLMKLRSRRRRPETTMDTSVPEALMKASHGSRPDADGVSLQSMSRAETRARVRECIGRISETYRAVLLLRDIEGMRIEEISRLLDVSSGTVKMRLHRARLALRSLLDPYMKEDAS